MRSFFVIHFNTWRLRMECTGSKSITTYVVYVSKLGMIELILFRDAGNFSLYCSRTIGFLVFLLASFLGIGASLWHTWLRGSLFGISCNRVSPEAAVGEFSSFFADWIARHGISLFIR
ncbi:uncharacterized protein LOC130991670 isoform X1 [Salvia miltiorrhiza]|uniref:uncharacterized protein LOC130991670 isoform X1 n=1 Tax=Salvia miltiorrhiza TaxID=226208 RepID=UPI0025AD2578|nr:uncharacterized protein LOC130991670 isoform X1 [Salvia miltiorrhiza]